MIVEEKTRWHVGSCGQDLNHESEEVQSRVKFNRLEKHRGSIIWTKTTTKTLHFSIIFCLLNYMGNHSKTLIFLVKQCSVPRILIFGVCILGNKPPTEVGVPLKQPKATWGCCYYLIMIADDTVLGRCPYVLTRRPGVPLLLWVPTTLQTYIKYNIFSGLT